MNTVSKYAAAFLNIRDDQLSIQDITHMQDAADFLEDHRRALFLLQVPVIDRAIKLEGLAQLMERFSLPSIVMRLFELLIDDGRAGLIAVVMAEIVLQYKRKHAIYTVLITTAFPLAAADRKALEMILDDTIVGIKEYEYRVDPSLIAGVRVQTDTLLWEYSIDKQLRDFNRVEHW